MTFPDWFYVRAVWEALSYVVAGVLWLLVLFGVLSPEWALGPSAILVIFLAVLKWLDVIPQLKELRAKRLLVSRSKRK
jgi:hypothetical protein